MDTLHFCMKVLWERYLVKPPQEQTIQKESYSEDHNNILLTDFNIDFPQLYRHENLTKAFTLHTQKLNPLC